MVSVRPPIRVMQVIARMNVGGPAMQVLNIATGLDADRFHVRVYTGMVEQGEEDYLHLRGSALRVIRIPGLGRSIRASGDALALRSLYQEMRRFRPDVVHSHTAKAGALARAAAMAAGAPVRVHTFHGHLLHGYFSPLAKRGVVATEKALAARTQRLVAVGERVRDDLLAAGVGRRDQYVVHAPGVAVNVPPSQRAGRQMLDLPPDRPVVALVARLLAIKRPDRFLDAAARIAAVRPDTVFVVAGGGPLLESLRRRSDVERLDVRYLGWRADVETIYAAADVVMLTSDNEGMPVSLIEAALCGVPAVTTDVGSASEVVLHGETGLVTPREAGALAAAGLQLLGDLGLRHDLGAAAQERAKRVFSAGTLVAETEALYRALHRQASPRGG